MIISHLRGDDELRPDFRKVGYLTCIFEISVYLVLTATATVNLENVLNYNNPDIVWSNSDSQNIYIKVVLKKSMRTGIAPKG